MLALTGCGGGGGGGIFATSGAGGGGAGGAGGALLGGMLLKGPISGARVFQDLNFNNQYDEGEPTHLQTLMDLILYQQQIEPLR